MSSQLERFINAQQDTYDMALSEIKAGHKQSHWMWYIFPQIKGLGMSSTSIFYGIVNLSEAKEYLAHPVLGKRLVEISGELLKLDSSNAEEIFGDIDAMKLKSSMTLFHNADPTEEVFSDVLEKFFGGEEDGRTIYLINRKN